MRNPIDLIVGDLRDKRAWRAYKARVKGLPTAYRQAAKGIERYVMHFGPVDDGPTLVRMYTDLVELLEQSAADGVSIRDLVGEDPFDFVEAFMDTYRGSGKSWVDNERRALATTIDAAIAAQSDEGSR